MFGIVMAVISIAMFSAVTMITMNYLPMDAMLAAKVRTKAQEGVQALSSGSIRYIKSVTDIDGFTHLPPPGTQLETVLEPRFAFIPPAPTGMAWRVESSYYLGLPAIAICLQPVTSIDEATQRGLLSLKNQFPSAAVFISSACQSVSNGPGNYLTYWVVASHHG